MLLTLENLAPDTPGVGGKAVGLVLARQAGLAVPSGFVLPAGALADPAELRAATRGRGPWIVRSSTAIEDRAAPGIFLSVRDVASGDVPAAVEAVRSSISSPTALAYLAARDLPRGTARMAVIVQEQVAGVGGTAYSRDPGRQPGVLVESGERLALVGASIAGDLDLAPALLREIAAAARRLEDGFGAPVDVEWVAGERLWIVQARRVPERVERPAAVTDAELEAALAFSRAEPDVVWTWDAAHNATPLSPAQAGLVELVEAAGAAGVRQRVVLGYLYTTPQGAPPPERIIDEADLPRVYSTEIAPAFERELGRMGRDLEETLAAYLAFYRLYARVLAPSLARARAVHLDAGTVSLAEVAPAWDVAAPSYGERALDAAARLTRLGDVDDVYFARAQAGVRRALAGLAARRGIELDDLTFLPLEDVRSGAPPPADAAVRAARARSLHRRLSSFAPPLSIAGGRPLFRPPGKALHGRGTGGRARGKVLKLDALRPAFGAGRVLVAATLIPTMAPLLEGAAAVVAEHGGLLGHGAALAREMGIPCVVGCLGALATLADGEEVWVDADAGVVVQLTRK